MLKLQAGLSQLSLSGAGAGAEGNCNVGIFCRGSLWSIWQGAAAGVGGCTQIWGAWVKPTWLETSEKLWMGLFFLTAKRLDCGDSAYIKIIMEMNFSLEFFIFHQQRVFKTHDLGSAVSFTGIWLTSM